MWSSFRKEFPTQTLAGNTAVVAQALVVTAAQRGIPAQDPLNFITFYHIENHENEMNKYTHTFQAYQFKRMIAGVKFPFNLNVLS